MEKKKKGEQDAIGLFREESLLRLMTDWMVNGKKESGYAGQRNANLGFFFFSLPTELENKSYGSGHWNLKEK